MELADKVRDTKKKADPYENLAVVREGDQIVLPKGMSYNKAIEWMQRRRDEDEREVNVMELIEAYPLDGAHALMLAIGKKYGWSGLTPTPGFFGDKPPSLVGIETGPGESSQVPWGRITVPGIDGYLATSLAKRNGRFVFEMTGKVKQKNKEAVMELAQLTRQMVKEQSVYRGKAIKVSFSEEDDEGEFDPREHAPKFMDVSSVRPEDLIFPKHTADLVRDALFTPIERTKWCREYGVPLKRGVLFEGPYGVGKTLTANVTAKKCVDNGWTFIYVDTVRSLQQAIFFAQQYQPAVVFAEDIDRVVAGPSRSEDIDAILNSIDGVDTKGSELITVLTTNHVERINRAMLRPGRLDAVVSVKPPDSDAVQRLLRLYGRGLVGASENLDAVADMLSGQIPAVVREVVERAKLGAIGRLSGHQTLTLNEQDLVTAANGMLAQVALVAPVETRRNTEVENIVNGLKHLGTVSKNPALLT
jgi:transitional endoplasmic reticulum ATPase